MSIVEELKIYMEETGFKLPKVAELTGIPYDRIYKWMKTGGQPKADDYQKLKGFISGKKTNSIEDSQEIYPVRGSASAPNNCMDTLAKALDVVLSQQKTIEAQLLTLNNQVAIIQSQHNTLNDQQATIHELAVGRKTRASA